MIHYKSSVHKFASVKLSLGHALTEQLGIS
ncbi:hypothetical protein VIAG107301_01260 [Vibrio agarivorans]